MESTRTDKQQPKAQRQPIPAFAATTIRPSAPAVRIIDSEPRLALGHYLADR
jgi:hypothetical protein